MARDHTDFTISPDSLPPSSCRPNATLHPSNRMSGICQPGKINPFQSDHLSMIPAQQESARHQSSSGPTGMQSESRAPNALPSLSNAANPFRSHRPVESSLGGDVNSNSNQVRHHVIKHRGMDSQINPFQSDPLSATSVQHECTGHQSDSAPTMSSTVHSDSMASIALLSLSHAENPYPYHGPDQSSLGRDINSNSNQVGHHVIKHRGMDSQINPFRSDPLSTTSVQHEKTQHELSSTPTMSSSVHSDSIAPNALPPFSNESCLDGDVNSNSNQVRHHVIKHREMDSQINPFQSNPLSATSVQQECTGHQSYSAPTMSSTVHSDSMASIALPSDLSHGHKEGRCVPHTINENSNLTDVENFSQGPGQSHSTSKTGWKMSFFQQVGCRASTVQSTSIGSSFNDHGIKWGDRCDNGEVSGAKGMSHYGSDTCGGYMRPQNTDIRDMPIMNSGMTSAINHYEGKLLTPTASQLSRYHTGNMSGSMSSKSKTGSSHYSQHHLDINNAVKVLLKEPPESESSSCSTSDRKQSAQYCTTMADVVTFCPSQSSSHSRDEQLWNSTKYYKSITDNDVTFPQQSCRGNSMTDNSTPEVISASATDYVCDVSSISSDAKYLYPEVDNHLVPGKLSLLDTDWAKRQWKYARCFDKTLPRENPSEVEAVHFYSILLKVHEFTSSTLSDCLLEYYKQLCLKCNLSYNRSISGDVITQIQDVVMKSSAVYSDEYLKMCLLFMKYPFVYDFDWFRKAVRLIEEEYCIRVPVHPQNQNFVFSILVDTRIAVMNNRFKRVMLRQVGKVWYDKKQSKTKTVFGDNALLRWERKRVFRKAYIQRLYCFYRRCFKS